MNLPKINIGNSQEEKIVTRELKVNQNVFIYNETVIPLCNISRISVVNEAKKPYDKNLFIMIVIGIALSCTGIGAVVGLPLIVIAVWLLYKIYQHNQGLGEYLKLNLNSGQDIYLYSSNHDFTIEVMDVIINCINSGAGYAVNMENCKIEAMQMGEGNNMNITRR
ncbi:hypothetical protein C807_02237 [Lachnospiraceae bacterium 28-4]|nr:hypothetical protein C807_02237 [Lachnospiraceae bacterium 28-4]